MILKGRVYTVAEAAMALDVGERSIRNYLRSGQLEGYKVRRFVRDTAGTFAYLRIAWKVPGYSLEAWMRAKVDAQRQLTQAGRKTGGKAGSATTVQTTSRGVSRNPATS